ncbi:hypothetical protein CE91St65_38900 [[Clostridium] symbiosum]|jgi:hypothetical protein|nr:hypothetical protein CE91St65_38900 [[Clostridium] symbiosum]BDF30915.1 hypothetical protein CE91St66_38920 [[Clostridium] symbiosum]
MFPLKISGKFNTNKQIEVADSNKYNPLYPKPGISGMIFLETTEKIMHIIHTGIFILYKLWL